MKNSTESTGLDKGMVDDFIFEMTLINPIEKIIAKLKNKDYRDCDVTWLDSKLDKFIRFAAETFGMKMPAQIERKPFPVLNDHNYKYYIEKFTTLLNYFKTL